MDMKILEQVVASIAELKIAMHLLAQTDGIITPLEQHLLDEADAAYLLAEEALQRKRIAQRIEGGGEIDPSLLHNWQELQDLRRAA